MIAGTDPSSPSADQRRTPHVLKRLTALVETGQIATMTELEAKALLVFLARADYFTGESFAGMETIAGDIGTQNVQRCRQAVQRLEKRGVLAVVKPGGGRNTSTIRRIECPQTGTVNVLVSEPDTGTPSVPVSPDENRDGQRPETGTVNDVNRDGQRPETGTRTVPRTPNNTYRTPMNGCAGKPRPAGVKNGKPRKEPQGDHPEFIRHFEAKWEIRYGTKLKLLAKDCIILSQILKLAGCLDQAKRVVDAYLACTEDFYTRRCHPPGNLLNEFNRFNVAASNGHKHTDSAESSFMRADFKPRKPTTEELALISEPPREGEPGHPDTVPLGPGRKAVATA